MQLASIATIGAENKEKDITPRIQEWEDGEKYNINTSYFATLATGFCSALVFLAGQLLLQGDRRRPRLIIAILLVVGVLQTITLAYYLQSTSKTSHFLSSLENPMVERLFLLDTNYQTAWSNTTVILYPLVAFVGLVTLIVAALYRFWGKQREWGLPELFKKAINIMLQATWLVMMWTTLAFLMHQRAELEGIDGNPLNDWSFGQILALSTWVPIFVDFFYTYFC